MEIFESFSRLKNLQHLCRVILPVGRAVQIAAMSDLGNKQAEKIRTDDAPLVMPSLAPGIGKEDVHAGKGCVGDHVLDDVNGVVAGDPHIGEALFVKELGKSADARCKHFAAEKVHFGVCFGDRRRRLAHSAADFKNYGGGAAKQRREVKELLLIPHLIFREQFIQGAGLRLRDMSAAHGKGADVALFEFFKFFRAEIGRHGAKVRAHIHKTDRRCGDPSGWETGAGEGNRTLV